MTQDKNFDKVNVEQTFVDDSYLREVLIDNNINIGGNISSTATSVPLNKLGEYSIDTAGYSLVDKNVLYVLTTSGKLLSFDINGSMKQLDVETSVYNVSYIQFEKYKDHIFVGDYDANASIEVYDASDPANLDAIETSPTTAAVSSLYVIDGVLYVTDLDNQRIISFDITDPANMSEISRTDISVQAQFGDYIRQGDRKYYVNVGFSSGILEITDITDETDMTSVASLDISGLDNGYAVRTHKNTAFITDSNDGDIFAIDLSDIENPNVVDTYTGDSDTNGAEQMEVVGHILFVSCGAGSNKVVAMDISDPSNLRKLYSTQSEDGVWHMNYDDIRGHLYVATDLNDKIIRFGSYVRNNKGTVTLLSGNTSVTVSHTLDFTPTKDDVSVTPAGGWLTSDSTKYQIQNVTSTSFDIVVDVDPTQDVDFVWKVRI